MLRRRHIGFVVTFLAGMAVGALLELYVSVPGWYGSLKFGVLGDYVGAIATGGGLVIAAVQVRDYRRSNEDLRRRELEALARAVVASGWEIRRTGAQAQLHAILTNGGTLPVFEVIVVAYLRSQRVGQVRVGTVAAGANRSIEFHVNQGNVGLLYDGVSVSDRAVCEVRFRDAYGGVWAGREGYVKSIRGVEADQNGRGAREIAPG